MKKNTNMDGVNSFPKLGAFLEFSCSLKWLNILSNLSKIINLFLEIANQKLSNLITQNPWKLLEDSGNSNTENFVTVAKSLFVYLFELSYYKNTFIYSFIKNLK